MAACLLLASCSLSEKDGTETLDEEDLREVIVFNEWLYRAGTPPRLKYHIERKAEENIKLEAVMTMYSQDESVGATSFNIALNSPNNIDYFAISPEKNRPVDEIELKDIYLNGTKYSVSKIFQVSPETDPPADDNGDGNNGPDSGDGGNSTVSCNGIPGARHQWDKRNRGYVEHPLNSALPSRRERADGKYEEIKDLSLFVDEDNNHVTICVVALIEGDPAPHKRIYEGTFVKEAAHLQRVPYQVTFAPDLAIRMDRLTVGWMVYSDQRAFLFDKSTVEGSPIDDILFEGTGADRYNGAFVPSVHIWPPEVVGEVPVTATATSLTIRVENKNEFADTKLFWVLSLASEYIWDWSPVPNSDELVIAKINSTSDPPIAKGDPAGVLIPAKSGSMNGVKEIVISAGIESGTNYRLWTFFKTGGYASLVPEGSRRN